MGRRMSRSKLFFGQLAGGQQPSEYRPTLSGFYGDVGAGQTEAVKTLGQQAQEETKGLAGKFDLTTTLDEKGQPVTSLAAGSKFRPSVDISKLPEGVTTVAPTTTGMTDEELAAAAKAAEENVAAWEKAGGAAQEKLTETTGKASEEAGKTITAAEEKVTKGGLGQRREASELEKQASSYQNTLASEPGTTNVEALASLSKFFDPKYAGLESGLKQGEIALARQQAVGNIEAKKQAEEARSGALKEYGEGVKSLGQTLKDEITKASEAESKHLKEFYGGKTEEAKKAQTEVAGTITKKKEEQEERDRIEFETTGKNLADDKTYDNLNNILDQLGGRGGKNWLRNQGTRKLLPLKSQLEGLADEAKEISGSSLITTAEKTKRLKDIRNKIDDIRRGIAGELAAFLGDTNTEDDDAIDAAKYIAGAGLIDSLSEDQKKVIRDRMTFEGYIPVAWFDLYKAFGGSDSDVTVENY